jgi:hypothetical protein
VSVSVLNSCPCFCSRLLQREEVLDDAVVDDDDVAGAVAVRVRVVLVRLAVRGPAGVAHAEVAVERRLVELLLEIRQLPFGADDLHSAAVDHGDAGAVVAAVLQFPEAADEDGNDLTGAYVADDSAHVEFLTF